MKTIRFFLGIVFCVAVLLSAGTAKQSDVLYQCSTMSGLSAGVYDGSVSLELLKGYGDFGLGTFDGLDGEMIVLDGRCYQVTVDGKVHLLTGKQTAPFALVKFFHPDITGQVGSCANVADLGVWIAGLFPSRNYLYAVRVDGVFGTLKVRSVPRQEKPYPVLSEALKEQKVYTHENVKGTLVGFWTPPYAQGIGAAGWHFHFLSDDRRVGGHVLDCALRGGNVGIDVCRDIRLSLPDNEAFRKAGQGPQAHNP